MYRLVFLIGIIAGYAMFSNQCWNIQEKEELNIGLQQLDKPDATKELRSNRLLAGNLYMAGWGAIAALAVALYWRDGKNLIKAAFAAILVLSLSGCYRPFQPNKLETIQTNEEAFLLPLIGDLDKQKSSQTEDYLKQNLVYTKQVQIPQQWVQTGYETMGANGQWKDAAILVRVDKSPVTREWTADPNSGTSNRNEAIWVMTSDQVEFSTGWTCTARIASRDDAVIFLHNYPNGSLTGVMDGEMRAKLQATFGLEVTDLPMHELRTRATPHILKVIAEVTDFFKKRGINITNLGITGGFVYKDPTISQKLVEVFNAEQAKSVAAAATEAQFEVNKKLELEATIKAKSLMMERQAEADGIKLVADAKSYEMEKAKIDNATYLLLKKIELERLKLEKWDGKFPAYFMGGDKEMQLLLQAPEIK